MKEKEMNQNEEVKIEFTPEGEIKNDLTVKHVEPVEEVLYDHTGHNTTEITKDEE